MAPPDDIPLKEAVDRGLIPCSSCGAKRADVRRVAGKDHFLCPRCARSGNSWIWILAGLTVAVVALVVLLLRARTPDARRGAAAELPPIPAHARDPEPWMKETLRLLEMKRYADARVRIQELLEPLPKQPELNVLMGRCLMSLRYYDGAIPYLKTAAEAGGPIRDEAELRLGLSLKTIGHAREALPYLEKPSGLDGSVRGELAEVFLDLERYEDALKLLPEGPETLWGRHRALVYSGKGGEAKKLLEGRDEREVGTLMAGQLREEGDFDRARRILSALQPEPGSPAWHRVQRGWISLAIESGNLDLLKAPVEALAADRDAQLQGEAIFADVIAGLIRKEKREATTLAWKFLAKTDKEFSPLRLERMMMRHLVGELKDADLEAEAAALSRFHANDLLWYLALVTGDRARAEAALAATPGHNYPYHAIRRLLKP